MLTATPQTTDAGLLRLLTCGSVDDGKSTVIGRLLYDTDSIYDDQLAAIERASLHKGDEKTNLALLTDGLRAEREQGITIDVAYRYFSTPRRSFILADAPGHEQYTRNMATGASTADVAVVLVDARTGVIRQTRRHATIASLMGVRHLALCVNKMDLVGFDRAVYDKIVADFETLVRPHGPTSLVAIPMCAVDGDNVVVASRRMDWYAGPTLLEHLETLELDRYAASEKVGARLPVQWVVRPQSDDASLADYRGYAGRVVAGSFKAGDAVVVLPSGRESTVAGVDFAGEPLEGGEAGRAVTLRLADDVDTSRGDLICSADRPATVRRDFEATLVWMAERPLSSGGRFTLRHTSRRTRAVVKGIRSKLDLHTGRDGPADGFDLNDIGRVSIRTAEPLSFDAYADCRGTGSFILIDEATKDTVAAGTILGPDRELEAAGYSI